MVVIIADDERFARRGIIENIPWYSFGVDTIIEAQNGIDCLKKAEEFHPDILIADIRMPKLNGIDLGKEIAARYPKCKMIIISAYSEKEYLKSAISLNVIAYVEKPIVISELEEAIQKAVLKIKEAEGIHEENDAYRLFEDILSQKKLSGSMQALLDKITQGIKKYSVALFYERGAKLKYRDLKLWIEEKFRFQKIDFYIYQDILPHFYVLLALDKGTEKFPDDLVAGYERVIREMGGDFFVSVGMTVDTPSEIGESFEYAKQGKYKLFHKGYGTVVYINNWFEPQEYYLNEEDRGQIINYFSVGQRGELVDAFHRIFDEIEKSSRNYSEVSVKRVLGDLLGKFVEIEKKKSQTEWYVWEEMFACHAVFELKRLFDRIVEIMLPEDTIQNLIVKRMILLIVDEYSSPELSISYICEKLGVGKSKACNIFKEEVGKTINEYITEYRINKAKQYLYDNLPLQEVARMVGYHDSTYFSKIFKKITGVTPSSYRRQTWND